MARRRSNCENNGLCLTELGSGLIMSNVPKKTQDAPSELAAMQQRIAQLEAANQELKAVSRRYMEMLGFVAHELKSPLASAVIGLYTVKDGFLGEITPAQKKSLESVAHCLEDLEDMILNYLELSRVEKDELDAVMSYFPLNDRVVQPVLEELEAQLQQRRMVVENDIPAGKVVRADAELLKIVFHNLLSNAAKYGREGGMIRLGIAAGERAVTLHVCNDSAGIAPDQIPALFQKFSRLRNPEYAGQRGTGLGLYICRQIVEKHGGRIWAESQMGEWVRFSFTLPQEERGECPKRRKS